MAICHAQAPGSETATASIAGNYQGAAELLMGSYPCALHLASSPIAHQKPTHRQHPLRKQEEEKRLLLFAMRAHAQPITQHAQVRCRRAQTAALQGPAKKTKHLNNLAFIDHRSSVGRSTCACCCKHSHQGTQLLVAAKQLVTARHGGGGGAPWRVILLHPAAVPADNLTAHSS